MGSTSVMTRTRSSPRSARSANWPLLKACCMILTETQSTTVYCGDAVDNFLDLHAKINEYLDKAIPLRELEGWMAPRTLIFYGAPDSALAELASAVELHLSEFHDRLRNQQSLRRTLAKYVSAHKFQWADTPSSETTTSASTRSSLLEGVSLFPSPIWHSEPVMVLS